MEKVSFIIYDSSSILSKEKDNHEKYYNFHKFCSKSNIIYMFFKDGQCLYIGETGTSLWERIITHTPSEKDQKWFKEGNRIEIIEMPECVDVFARKAIEQVFILAYNRNVHSTYNEK